MHIENIQQRALLLRKIRHFFDQRGFYEVQTPALSADTVVDRRVEPIAVTNPLFPLNHHGTKTYYLQTSPEFAMKRLLADGMKAIYQIAPVFRLGDIGDFHNSEFTMLEWYRVGDDYQNGMRLLADVVETLGFPAVNTDSYQQLFEHSCGLNPHRASAQELQNVADQHCVAYPESYIGETADAWLDLLFSELIQPALDCAIVFDYPCSQSQLAQIRHNNYGGNHGDNRANRNDGVAERFELFISGIEIANGYHELLDANELALRLAQNNQQRRNDGRPALPTQSRLLTAMRTSGIPACSGTALGIDRLLMVLLKTQKIEDVIAFPFETS